ncbi:class I SAM-dependent methyltransferase [Rhodobacteraceae bacterium W635]|nr:class I SAM-dependent methyltransferase [Rhodobacteraceae bacterium W635]
MLPQRLHPILNEAETAAANGGLEAALPVLRRLTQDEFAVVLARVSNDFPVLRDVLPVYPSAEIQRAWAGNSDFKLLQQTVMFSHVCERFYTRHRGQAPKGARILDYGCGWGRLIRQMLYFSDPDALFGADPWQKSLEHCKTLRVPGTVVQIDYRPQALPHPIEDIDLGFAFSVMTHIGERNTAEILRAVRAATAPGGLFVFTIRPREYWAARAEVLGNEKVTEMLRQHDEEGVAFLPSGASQNAGSSEYGESSFVVEKVKDLAVDAGWHFSGTEWLLIDPYQLIVCLYKD